LSVGGRNSISARRCHARGFEGLRPIFAGIAAANTCAAMWNETNAESIQLLASLLGRQRAARRVLEDAGSLRRVLDLPGEVLERAYGVRPPRARFWEALRRLRQQAAIEALTQQPTLDSPERAFAAVTPLFFGRRHERLLAIALDPRLRPVCAPLRIADGEPDCVTVTPRLVFEPLLRVQASRALLAHNHPSGDPTPSQQDELLTRRLCHIGEAIGIPIHDHIVIGHGRGYSFARGAYLEGMP
jgi:DNA repair protein RadC